MPYLLLCIGCVFLGLGVLGLFVPSLQSLDLLTVQTLSHHRLDYLNTIYYNHLSCTRRRHAFCMFFILSSMYIFSMV